jgi:hypothetical protein
MIIYKSINQNISDIILEIYPKSNNEFFEYIEINFINKFENLNLRKIYFNEIIENETEKAFVEIKDTNNNIKFIRYNLNLKTYLGNNIHLQKNIFNDNYLFTYNVGVKINSDMKLSIFYNNFSVPIKNEFNLIPYNSFQFYKLSHIYLLGESNIYKIYYKKNTEILNTTFKYHNTNNFHIISVEYIRKIIGSIYNFVKIESSNLILFKIFNHINTNNFDISIKDIFTIDINYINY